MKIGCSLVASCWRAFITIWRPYLGLFVGSWGLRRDLFFWARGRRCGWNLIRLWELTTCKMQCYSGTPENTWAPNFSRFQRNLDFCMYYLWSYITTSLYLNTVNDLRSLLAGHFHIIKRGPRKLHERLGRLRHALKIQGCSIRLGSQRSTSNWTIEFNQYKIYFKSTRTWECW